MAGGKKKWSKVSLKKVQRQVKSLSYALANEKRLGSYSAAAKGALSVLNGASGDDVYHKIITMGPFTDIGQYVAIIDNTAIVGSTGVIQPGFPRTVTEICFDGEGLVFNPTVPIGQGTVELQQQLFNWALVWIQSGIDPQVVFNSMNPPLFVPSAQTKNQQSIFETLGPSGNLNFQLSGQTMENEAATWRPSAIRTMENGMEVEDSEAKRLRPTPNASIGQSVDSAEAQAVVSELLFPRMQILMSGTGACVWTSSTVLNHRIKAYQSRKIHMKVDDQLVLMAKAANGQQVTLNGQITFKTYF